MIALISSTLTPSASPSHDGARTTLTSETRLAQTIESVQSVRKLGFQTIFLADNSPVPPGPVVLEQLSPARVLHFPHYPYRNKGIAEARLLLAACDLVPDTVPIMKLSARYTATFNLAEKLGSADVCGLFQETRRVTQMSTRAYAVRNRAFLHAFLAGTLDELYRIPWRITGPRSLILVLRRLLSIGSSDYPFADPPVGLEIAAALWLKRRRAALVRLRELGIHGSLGSWTNPRVTE